jgi:hypothetical protein
MNMPKLISNPDNLHLQLVYNWYWETINSSSPKVQELRKQAYWYLEKHR